MLSEENSGGCAVIVGRQVQEACDDTHETRSAPSPITNHDSPLTSYFPARSIAQALNVTKKTVVARAKAEKWPSRQNGNRVEFQPPQDLAQRIPLPRGEGQGEGQTGTPRTVKFADLTHDQTQRDKVLARRDAVEFYRQQLSTGCLKEVAIAATVLHFSQLNTDPLITDHFSVSASSLRRWDQAYAAHGLDGLVEQKLGRAGRKSILSQLDPETRHDFIVRGKALALGHGSGGNTNIARAARELASQPTLPAPLRETLHGAHASKSYVNHTIREALRVAPLTAALAQGARHARLSSRFTPGDYSNVRPGDVFVSDDMTGNCIVWCEWPNAIGYRIGQPQLLPVMDLGSERWLNARGILRESGQYNSDDIWGLFGDVFDSFGLPRRGFLLEGGHWQSNKVIGTRSGLSDDERIGGLASLGLKVWHARGPQGKAVIETSFNQLQYIADNFPGYIGREQRYDVQERVEALRKQCQSGRTHPNGKFPHLSQWVDHVRDAMEKMNQERNDGIICRGATPLEKWREGVDDGTACSADFQSAVSQTSSLRRSRLVQLPDNAKWLYRSARSFVQITRNGLRVTQGSGAKMLTYYYDNPELLTPLQGQKAIVFWNDNNPATDAIVLRASNRRFIGVAKYVQPLHRFDATPAQLDSEHARKKAAMHYSRTELRTISPHLGRLSPLSPLPMDPEAQRIGAEINAASARAEHAELRSTALAREVDRIHVDPELVSEACSRRGDESLTENPSAELSAEDLNKLLQSD